jgi:hypothetical protein
MDDELFTIRVEFAGKGAAIQITALQMRDAEGRFKAFEECIKALMFAHGMPVTS